MLKIKIDRRKFRWVVKSERGIASSPAALKVPEFGTKLLGKFASLVRKHEMLRSGAAFDAPVARPQALLTKACCGRVDCTRRQGFNITQAAPRVRPDLC